MIAKQFFYWISYYSWKLWELVFFSLSFCLVFVHAKYILKVNNSTPWASIYKLAKWNIFWMICLHANIQVVSVKRLQLGYSLQIPMQIENSVCIFMTNFVCTTCSVNSVCVIDHYIDLMKLNVQELQQWWKNNWGPLYWGNWVLFVNLQTSFQIIYHRFADLLEV